MHPRALRRDGAREGSRFAEILQQDLAALPVLRATLDEQRRS